MNQHVAAIVDRLHAIYRANGFVTDQAVLAEMTAAGVALSDVDRVCEQLLAMGVIIENDVETPTSEYDDYSHDRSRSDYDRVFDQVRLVDSNLTPFVEEVRAIRPPQLREWHSLFPQVRAGNRYAHRRLIEMYLRTVLKMAVSFHRRFGVPLAETIQEGCVGLLLAVEKYEVGRQDSFLAYFPWWVRRIIMREIPLSANPSVHFSAPARDQLWRISEILVTHGTDYVEGPVSRHLAEEIAVKLVCSVEVALTCLDHFRAFDSTEALRDEDSASMSDRGSFADSLVEMCAEEEVRSAVYEAVAILSPRERRVLKLRFGLDGQRQHTLEETAHCFGLSRERIRQIEAKAIRRLKHSTHSVRLKSVWTG